MMRRLLALVLLLAFPSQVLAVQDWPTRRSQPGVIVAMKAGEAWNGTNWVADGSASLVDFWKCGPAGCGTQPNYYRYWTTGTAHPNGYETVVGDPVVKSSGHASFRWTYNGDPKSEDEAYDTYRMGWPFTGPPGKPIRPQIASQAFPMQFDAAYPSAQSDPSYNYWEPVPAAVPIAVSTSTAGALSIHYTGSASVCALTVTDVGLTTTTTGRVDDLSITFTSRTTVADLITAITASGHYTASNLTDANQRVLRNLRNVSGADIKGATVTLTGGVNTVRRTSGSWVTDGYTVGARFNVVTADQVDNYGVWRVGAITTTTNPNDTMRVSKTNGTSSAVFVPETNGVGGSRIGAQRAMSAGKGIGSEFWLQYRVRFDENFTRAFLVGATQFCSVSNRTPPAPPSDPIGALAVFGCWGANIGNRSLRVTNMTWSRGTWPYTGEAGIATITTDRAHYLDQASFPTVIIAGATPSGFDDGLRGFPAKSTGTNTLIVPMPTDPTNGGANPYVANSARLYMNMVNSGKNMIMAHGQYGPTWAVGGTSDMEFVTGDVSRNLAASPQLSHTATWQIYGRQSGGNWVVRDHYEGQGGDNYLMAAGPKSAQTWFSPQPNSPNWASLGGISGDANGFPYPRASDGKQHMMPIIANRWQTLTWHVKIGHWWRDNINGWLYIDQNPNLTSFDGMNPSRPPVYGADPQLRTSGNTIMRVDGGNLPKRDGGIGAVYGFPVGGKIYLTQHDSNYSPLGTDGFYTIASVTDTTITTVETLPTSSDVIVWPTAVITSASDPSDRNTSTLQAGAGMEDADILGADPAHYPGNTGMPDDPGPVTYANYTITGITNAQVFITKKVDAKTYYIKNYDGTKPVTGKAWGVGVRRHWRDSTYEFYVGLDGQPSVLVTKGSSDVAFGVRIKGEHGFDLPNPQGWAPSTGVRPDTPYGIMYGQAGINLFKNQRAHRGKIIYSGTVTGASTTGSLIDRNYNAPDNVCGQPVTSPCYDMVWFRDGPNKYAGAVITSWNNTTKTLTFDSMGAGPGKGGGVLPVAPSVGDRYYIGNSAQYQRTQFHPDLPARLDGHIWLDEIIVSTQSIDDPPRGGDELHDESVDTGAAVPLTVSVTPPCRGRQW